MFVNTQAPKRRIRLSPTSQRSSSAPLCWEVRLFAAHDCPSYVATHNRALVVSLIHKAAISYVRKHTSPQEKTEPDAAPIDNREAEEEFCRRQESPDSMDRSVEGLQRQRLRLFRKIILARKINPARMNITSSEDRRRKYRSSETATSLDTFSVDLE